MARRFSATQQSTVKDLQRVMTNIKVHHPDAGGNDEGIKSAKG